MTAIGSRNAGGERGHDDDARAAGGGAGVDAA